MTTELHILSLLFCFMGSAFFSGMETGTLCINRARLAHLVRSGSKAAAMLDKCLSDTQSFLATVLIGNNLMNVALATLSAGLAQLHLRNYPAAQIVWQFVMALMVLCFSEYLPKLFFTTRPLRRTMYVIRPFYVIERMLTPLTGLVMLLTQWLTPNSGEGDRRFLMTREYLQNVVSDAKDGSRITAFERMMINRVLTLHAQTAAQLMTPLPQVTKTTANAMLSQCYGLVRDSGHTRLPVFDTDNQSCVGVLNVLDIMIAAPDPSRNCAADYMQAPLFVDADLQADDVLPLMRKHRKHLALVRAKGKSNVLGIITEENIISALTRNLRETRA
ncbi:MAG: CNNM domain-containing protein [Kiritimatiellae bacterium]|nr:CNNM domain-containing protein [Kiritimatiellia bacterium]